MKGHLSRFLRADLWFPPSASAESTLRGRPLPGLGRRERQRDRPTHWRMGDARWPSPGQDLLGSGSWPSTRVLTPRQTDRQTDVGMLVLS